MLYLGVVRSPHAHARIGAVSTAEAASLPGVVAVASAEDLLEVSHPIPPYKSERRFRAFDQHVLAKTVVRYVGEPVAVVVAVDPVRLAEALEAVAVDYEPQPAASSIDAAIATGAPLVHQGWPDNVAYVSRAAVGDVDAAIGQADLLVAERFRHPRLAAMLIETRGVLVYVDDSGTLIVVALALPPNDGRAAFAMGPGREE